MKRLILITTIVALVALTTVPSMMATDDCQNCPEQGQWVNQSWSFDFDEKSMSGSLGQEMVQWTCPNGMDMEQNQSAFGEFKLEMDGLYVNLNSHGYQYQSHKP